MIPTNRFISISLAIAAGICWIAFAVLPSFGIFGVIDSYPAVQMPMAISFTAAACFGWTLTWLSQQRDGETRCRRCRQILRGLSEPRCPECGERI